MSENYPELVTDPIVFRELRKQCESVIDTEKRLPDFVFRRSFERYYAFEYSYVYELGEFLSKISTQLEDDSVNYLTLEPTAENYWQRFSFFGLASFNPSEIATRYLPVISRGGKLASFTHGGGNVAVLWGSSLKWALFYDRVSSELAVLACPNEVDAQKLGEIHTFDAATLSSYEQGLYFWKPEIASSFVRRFLANYAIGAA